MFFFFRSPSTVALLTKKKFSRTHSVLFSRSTRSSRWAIARASIWPRSRRASKWTRTKRRFIRPCARRKSARPSRRCARRPRSCSVSAWSRSSVASRWAVAVPAMVEVVGAQMVSVCRRHRPRCIRAHRLRSRTPKHRRRRRRWVCPRLCRRATL